MATNFPTGLDDFTNYVDGTTILEAATLNDMQWAIEALQAKVGIDSSTVVTSHDYLLAHIGSLLGSWASKSENTVYQAATDGFVCAGGVSTASGAMAVYGYSDGSNPPTTLRAGNSSQNTVPSSITFLVKKGDYWKVTSSGFTVQYVYWIPMGV